MNLKKIFDVLDFSKVDHEAFQQGTGRRAFFKKAGDVGAKAALAALPIALIFSPKVVKAQTADATEVLNFALTLEYLEDEFYKMALNSGGLIPSGDKAVFMQISKHETAHVNFLKTALGEAAIAKPSFDFTAGGTYGDVFSNYMTFLALSQAFEDTGVRAYKGQAGNLISSDTTLTAALQIHSVEARHASEVRRLRGKRIEENIKGWITGKEASGLPQPIYNGEDNVTHAGASLNDIDSLDNIAMDAKTESFDEPLTKEQVVSIVTPFLAQPG